MDLRSRSRIQRAAPRAARESAEYLDLRGLRLTLAETADLMGQDDPPTTWKHYLKLFDRSKVGDCIRAGQESVG